MKKTARLSLATGVALAAVATTLISGAGAASAATAGATLYDKTFYADDSVGPGTLAASLGSFNDRASSIKVVGTSSQESICFYLDANFSGAHFSGTADAGSTLMIPVLRLVNPAYDNSISSIRPKLPGDCN
ncbi:hypothetical protein [Amycolatopsis sp. DSM 110486]|uniref:hypothetical protein n=1 Tax=Amycolatopsis sp. DSM 110486 TaxID=2865832 RepID=UPI001C696F61|nr:hypothetical protein [Amycolatopsis sp. DSM 110486]QYN19366.1 hypothetical protein K1T34_43230 [Amycolatopsis sp. DSM 110486]